MRYLLRPTLVIITAFLLGFGMGGILSLYQTEGFFELSIDATEQAILTTGESLKSDGEPMKKVVAELGR